LSAPLASFCDFPLAGVVPRDESVSAAALDGASAAAAACAAKAFGSGVVDGEAAVAEPGVPAPDLVSDLPVFASAVAVVSGFALVSDLVFGEVPCVRSPEAAPDVSFDACVELPDVLLPDWPSPSGDQPFEAVFDGVFDGVFAGSGALSA
jgi:hypothetical protein